MKTVGEQLEACAAPPGREPGGWEAARRERKDRAEAQATGAEENEEQHGK
jgi:hypothetical protein